MRTSIGVLVRLRCFAAGAGAPQGEGGMQFTAGGMAAQQIVHSHVRSGERSLSGLVLGAEGGLVSNHFVVRLRYGEGRVNRSPAAPPRTRRGRREALVASERRPGSRSGWDQARAPTRRPTGPTLARLVGPRDRARNVAAGSHADVRRAVGRNSPATSATRRSKPAAQERTAVSSYDWRVFVRSGRLGYRIESTHAEGLRETSSR